MNVETEPSTKERPHGKRKGNSDARLNDDPRVKRRSYQLKAGRGRKYPAHKGPNEAPRRTEIVA